MNENHKVVAEIGSARKGRVKPNIDTTTLSPLLPPFLESQRLKEFMSEDLVQSLLSPIKYQPKTGPNSWGGVGYGYEATLLPRICEVFLDAERAHRLVKTQLRLAVKAGILHRGFARVGIIGLIDEATGYQDVRARDALAQILETFIAKELRKWIKTFPVEYYRELFRLRGWTFPQLPANQSKRPVMVGRITNDVIYDRLAPGVRQELNRLTPRDEKGRLKAKLFQRLTDEVGHPKLREHLAAVVTLMKASDTWEQFMSMLNRALPRFSDTPYLPFKD